MAWNESANVCIADSTDIFRQPLSRLDCDGAGMTWNDAANVCGAAAEAMPEPQVAQPMPESGVADSLSQPLTRLNCDRAGMTWNDAANVCVADSGHTGCPAAMSAYGTFRTSHRHRRMSAIGGKADMAQTCQYDR